MKLRFLALIVALAAAGAARADSTGYAYCSTYDAYVMLYKSTDQIEELGKLRCNEKVEVITRWLKFYQVRTNDGRVGLVRSGDIYGAPASPAQPKTPFGLTNADASTGGPAVLPLNNRDILNMQGMRLGADVIITKIQSSQSDFDTSPAALQKLKFAGLPDKVIQAMIQAPHATDMPAPKPAEFVEVKIPDGTAIDVALSAEVSSDAVQQGTIVTMSVVHDVVVNGIVVFQHGSQARARIVAVTAPGRMGRPGEVGWAMQDVAAVNGDRVPVDFTSRQSGAGSEGGVDGAIAPTWEFRKKNPTIIPAGQNYQAVVHGNVVMKLTPALAASLTAPKPDDQAPTTSTPNAAPDSQASSRTSVPPGSKP